jgi:hypothetical protein
VIALLPLLLAVLADTEDPRQRRGMLYQLRNRLLPRDTDPRLHPRLEGIRKQYGVDVLRQVQAILEHQRIPANRVRRLLVWLGAQVNQNPGRSAEDWPDLSMLQIWQQAVRVELGAIAVEHAELLMSHWRRQIDEKVREVFHEQNLQPDTDAYRRTSTLIPWIFSRMAMGDEGPWPDLLWLLDWAFAETVESLGLEAPEDPEQADQVLYRPDFHQAMLDLLMPLSSATASRRSADWHGQGDLIGSDEGVWSAWHRRVEAAQAEDWRPRPGEVIRRWPNGFTLHNLSSSFAQFQDETKIMDHCVGRDHGRRNYWPGVQRGTKQIWSLRNPQGYPVVTFEVEMRYNKPYNFPQIYAPQNTPPHPAHISYVFDAIGPHLERVPSHIQQRFMQYVTGEHHPAFQWVLKSPSLLLRWVEVRRPTDRTRRAFLDAVVEEHRLNPSYLQGDKIRRWINHVEPQGHPDVLEALVRIGDLRSIERYYEKIGRDFEITPEIRKLFLEEGTPDLILWLATQEGRTPETLSRALTDPFLATAYAIAVENKSGNPDPTVIQRLWERALTCPYATLLFEYHVFGGPTDTGRRAVSVDATASNAYAWHLDDRTPHPDTIRGVISGAMPDRMDSADVFRIGDAPLTTYPSVLEALDLRDLFPDVRQRYRPLPIFELNRSRILSRYPERPDGTLVPEIEDKLIALADPEVLGEVAKIHWRLIHRPGTELIWSNPQIVPHLISEYRFARGEDADLRLALERLFADPKLRRRAIKSPRSAYLIARFVDGKPTRETLNQAKKDPAVLVEYIKNLIDDMDRLPADVRRKLALGGRHLNREQGFRQLWVRGGGWGHSREDYATEASNKIIRETFAFVARDLTRRWKRKTRAERRELLGILREMQEWIERGSYSPPPDRFMTLSRRYYPGLLSWLDHRFWGRSWGISPEKPLNSVVKDLPEVPRVVFVGHFGRGGDDAFIRVPALTDTSDFAKLLRGQSSAEGRAGDAIWKWYSSLDGRHKRYVRRRLEIEAPVTPEKLFDAVSVLWGAATVLDAERETGSELFHQIEVEDTPLLFAIPWTTPKRQVGWLLVYPSHGDQISWKARSKGWVREAEL